MTTLIVNKALATLVVFIVWILIMYWVVWLLCDWSFTVAAIINSMVSINIYNRIESIWCKNLTMTTLIVNKVLAITIVWIGVLLVCTLTSIVIERLITNDLVIQFPICYVLNYPICVSGYYATKAIWRKNI